jgi:hypothetical protein
MVLIKISRWGKFLASKDVAIHTTQTSNCDDNSTCLFNIIHFNVLKQNEIKLSLPTVTLHHLAGDSKMKCMVCRSECVRLLTSSVCYGIKAKVQQWNWMYRETSLLVCKRSVGTVGSFIIDRY